MFPSFQVSLRCCLRLSSSSQPKKGSFTSVNDVSRCRLNGDQSFYCQKVPSLSARSQVPRHHCAITTMARKPKAADTAAPATASPSAPNGTTRRSSRRVSSKPAYAEDNSGDDEGDTLVGEGDALREAADHYVQDQATTPRQRKSDAVKRAIESLDQLGQKLHRDSKRQKRALEESDNARKTDKDASDETSAGLSHREPQPAGEKRASNPKKPQPKESFTRDISGGEDEEDGDGTYVVSDGDARDAADSVLEVAERGAARPPAVNSSYLPLPWKGRLGYVSYSNHLPPFDSAKN